MIMTLRPAAFLSLAIIMGCSAEEERAPMLQSAGGVTNPVSCSRLAGLSPTPSETGRFIVDAATAGCLADGQWCPAAWVTDRCDAGEPYARCVGGFWVLSCEVLVEAGTDVGSDS